MQDISLPARIRVEVLAGNEMSGFEVSNWHFFFLTGLSDGINGKRYATRDTPLWRLESLCAIYQSGT